LQGGGPPRLADRAVVHRRAAALVRFLDRMAGWARKARRVGYLDDGYAAAQLLLADWEAAGAAAAHERSQTALRELLPTPFEPTGRADEPGVSHSRQ
jgi:hypothetical protein